MNKLQQVMLMVAVAVMSPMAMAAEGDGSSPIDVSGAVSHINGLSGPITTIGTAMLGIFALILGFKLIKRFF